MRDELWKLILSKASVPTSAPRTVNGRLDLRGLHIHQPVRGRENAGVIPLSNLTEIRGVNFENIDFSDSVLDEMRLFDCKFSNCRFDGASCKGWRIWGTSILESTFKSTNWRNSFLGGVDGIKRNSFYRLDLTKTDMRGCNFFSADFNGCDFINAKISDVEFEGSTFTQCVFSGKIDGVIFRRHAFKGEFLPANEMHEVDFKNAHLRHVEFHQLNMDSVNWPEDEEHLIIHDYIKKLKRVVEFLENRKDQPARSLHLIFSRWIKRAGDNQKVGIANLRDIEEYGGVQLAQEVVALLSQQ